MPGQRSWGRDKTPPIKGLQSIYERGKEETLGNMPYPMICPIAAANGSMENPRAIFVSSVSSAMILFATPMFPFTVPFKKRL
jgi:hypothetical protein